MIFKINIFLSFFISAMLLANGQGIKIPNLDYKDSSRILNFHCGAGKTVEDMKVLVVWDDKQIPLSEFQNYIFNISDIDTINVFKENSPEVLEYGYSAKDGLIYIFSKSPISWISSTELLRKYGDKKTRKTKDILLFIDGKEFSLEREYYFAENIIKEVLFNDQINGSSDNKLFKKALSINTTLKSK